MSTGELSRLVGSRQTSHFTVRPEHTVPALPVNSPAITTMPAVLATPMLVAMVECACTAHLATVAPQVELSLGIEVEIAHVAATPPGMTVTVTTEVAATEGRKVRFAFTAHDGVEEIGRGRHTRAIVAAERFAQRLAEKQARTA